MLGLLVHLELVVHGCFKKAECIKLKLNGI